LAVTFIEAPDVAQQRLTLPQEFKDSCTAGGFSYEGNAADKSGLDLKGAPDGIYLIYDGFTAKGKGAMAACIIAALFGIASIICFSKTDPHREARAIAAAKKGSLQQ
jgi:iron transport multicopper oxidase